MANIYAKGNCFVMHFRDRFIVRASKTEHHDGHGTRFVPLWPEVRELLADGFDAAEPGSEYVITMTRRSESNLRTQMTRIVERAGLEPWPKLFQNLRATRSTEVSNEYGASKEAKWIGHSRKIANKHYFQITDDDFAAAASCAEHSRIESHRAEREIGRVYKYRGLRPGATRCRRY